MKIVYDEKIWFSQIDPDRKYFGKAYNENLKTALLVWFKEKSDRKKVE